MKSVRPQRWDGVLLRLFYYWLIPRCWQLLQLQFCVLFSFSFVLAVTEPRAEEPTASRSAHAARRRPVLSSPSLIPLLPRLFVLSE